MGKLTARKAKKMLREGVARGHKLTGKQKRLFGLIAGGGQPTKLKKGKRRKSHKSSHKKRGGKHIGIMRGPGKKRYA